MFRILLVVMLVVGLQLPACARYQTTARVYGHYTQVQVAGPLAQDDVITFVGDSLTGRGDNTFQSCFSSGWMTWLRNMNASYHPTYNFTLVNAGYAYLSSTVLNYPGVGDGNWRQYVVASNPTILVIWIGIDDMLAGNGNFDMAAYGVNLQQIIDRARSDCPRLRQIVLVTPLAYGEKRVGQNPHDVGINNVIAVINQTSINNHIPVIDMRSMIIDADLYYNGADFPRGVLLGDSPWGIHPITSTSAIPPDSVNFNSSTGNALIAATFFSAFGE